MHLKLACADFTFPLLPHDAVLDLIAVLGFDGVDVGLVRGPLAFAALDASFAAPSQAGKRLGKHLARPRAEGGRRLSANGGRFRFAGSQSSGSPAAPQSPRLVPPHARLRPGLRHPARLGLARRSLPTRSRPPPLSPARPTNWPGAAQQAAAAGLVFSVEAHLGSIVPNPRQALRLVQRVAGLTLTLDYTHFTRMGIADSQVEPLIQYASHFHARGARKGRLQTSFAENTIDYRRIVKMMRATGYRGFLGIEYVWTEWEHCNQVDNLSETILWRDFFQELSENGS